MEEQGFSRKHISLLYITFLILWMIFFSGSSYGVIQIINIVDLQKIGNDSGYPLNGEYELTQDIDASDTINWNGGAGFMPIGDVTNRFTGKFNGKGYKIQNLYINRPSQDYVGLFGYIGSGGEVWNLGIENVYVSGGSNVGGLVGDNLGLVSKSYSAGSVLGNYWAVGGLVGYNSGTVFESYSTSSVSGDYYLGGLVGYNLGIVSHGYSTGTVDGEGVIGGLVGWNESGTVSDSYWDIETSGQSSSAGGEGKTTAQMKQQATFVNWDFVDVWGIVEDTTYPYLKWQYIVPDIVGQPQSSAESMITDAGLTVGTVSEQCSNSVPAGNVAGQNPPAGTQVSPGSAVDIVISTGPCPEGEGGVEGTPEGTVEGIVEGEGAVEGTPEGIPEGTVEGSLEGTPEGTSEGMVEGTPEGTPEGEGIAEGEGIVEGTPEGTIEGSLEGTPEGTPEGMVEGTPEGTPEGEGIAEGEGIVEGTPEGTIEGSLEGTSEGSPEGVVEGEKPPHSADPNGDWVINLSELLRVIQFFNFNGYHCELGSEDGYAPGYDGDKTCVPHGSDYNPQDWVINLTELLRLIQFFNFEGYHPCDDGEDGYCPGSL